MLFALTAAGDEDMIADMAKLANDNGELLTVREVAKRHRVSVATVKNWCADGKIPGAYKIGNVWRIPARGLSEFIRRSTQ